VFSLDFDEDPSARALLQALRSYGFDWLTAREAARLTDTDD
jgi:hypothetical protein